MEHLEDLESRVIIKNGEHRLITWNVIAIRNDDGEVVGSLNSGRDITETKKLQEEVLRISKLESVGMLAGGIAHDFNNILTAVLGNISLGQTKVHPEEEAYDIMRRAELAAIRAKDLTQQLLVFSKGGEPIKKTAYISNLIRETAAFSLRGSNVRCKFSIFKDLWPVDIDEGQFAQVINNLVINAKQSMWEGGLISIRAANMYVRDSSGLPLKSGRYVKISVKDRGVGISKDNIRKIFDPYFTTRQNGSGLGLASAFSIVKNHGGHVSVRSELGSGTTFDVFLPASDKDVSVPKKMNREDTPMDKGRVMVMDDEAMIREVTGEMLALLGYEAEFALSGEEALKKYKSALDSDRPYRAVIVDLTIPGGMGGKETIKKLLEIDPEVKAIVSSGYSNDPILAEFKQHGFSGIVVKPYRLGELREALSQVLNDH
jgi:signal transduction histidine kinase/ActR/RegA family two-component response regulator